MCAEVLQDNELSAIQYAFDRTCIQLGVDKDDEGRRAHLAPLMLSLVEEGECDLDDIVKRAAFQMEHPH